MIQYDPWQESHAPKTFHRTDPTGRWSPIEEGHYEYEPKWLPVIGVIFFGIVGAFVLYLWATS